MTTRTLDCKALSCPMPIVQISLAMRELGIGEELLVEACDPAFLADVEAWARMTGNELYDIQEGAVNRVTVRKTS